MGEMGRDRGLFVAVAVALILSLRWALNLAP